MKRIALIIKNITWSFDTGLADALGQLCANEGMRLMVYESRHGSLEHMAHILTGHNTDGAILLADSLLLTDPLEVLQDFIHSLAMPCVTIGLRFPGIPSVEADNREGMRLLMHHLFAQGATRIAHVCGPTGSREAEERKATYLAAMSEQEIPVKPEWIVQGHFSPVSGYNSTLSLLPLLRAGELDAITYANDEAAAGGMRLLEAEAIQVPEHVLVTGYGDTPLGLLTHPPLTTVSNHPSAIAREALSLLTNIMDGKKIDVQPTPLLTPAYLCPNASSGAKIRQQARKALLGKAPLTNLHHAELFPETDDPDTFWAEVTDKLKRFRVSFFLAIRFEMSREDTENGGSIPQGTLAYGYHRGKLHPTGLTFPSPLVLPEGMYPMEGSPLLFLPLLSGDSMSGYLLASADAVDAHYLDDLCRYVIAWMDRERQRMERDQYVHQLSDTLRQLTQVNRRINELNVHNTLEDAEAMEALRTPAAVSAGEESQYIILLLDIDGLRQINLRHGYEEGDLVLRRVEKALTQCVRERDQVMRQGGDSFMLLLKQSGPRMVDVLQDRLIQQLDMLNARQEKGYRIDFTWGYACGNVMDDMDATLRKADDMLHMKKRERHSVIRHGF